MGWAVAAWLTGSGVPALAAPAPAPAPAPTGPASEEIIVYADDFARWDGTRWVVDTELMLPMGTTLGSDANHGFRTHALQMHAVVACDKDVKLGKKAWEIGCAIEDVAIVTTTDSQYGLAAQPGVQAVLDEIDAKLTGAVIQCQVDKDGGVTNVDLEGITSDNAREREINESVRQLLTRLMAGFHARIPDHAQRVGQWLEKNSLLMTIPSDLGSRGSSELVHTVSAQGDLRLVQTLGEGMAMVNLANPLTDLFLEPGRDATVQMAPPGAGFAGGGIGFVNKLEGAVIPPLPDQAHVSEPTQRGPSMLDVETTFEMKASGVAIFHRKTGVMTERVWAVIGTPTASTLGGSLISTAPYVHRGRIRELGDNEHPDLGPTAQVAWPGYQGAGLARWVPL